MEVTPWWLEPGTDTDVGDFTEATGTPDFETVLDQTLDPAFSAPEVVGVPVTFLSSRLTFSIKMPPRIMM